MKTSDAATRVIEWFGCLGIGVPAAALLMLFSQSGCSTMKPVEAQPAELQQKIRSGALVAVGDRVAIVDIDHRDYRFVITGIDDIAISGKDVRVPIDSIVGIRTRAFSVGRTVGLAAGVGATGAVLIYCIATAAAAASLAAGI